LADAQSRPTILQIIPRLDTGGAELTTIEITEAVVRAGGRMLVASEGGRMEGEIARAGGSLIPMPAGAKNPATILANARRLARIIAAERVKLIHARSRAPAWSALLAARRTGLPFVTTYHGAYGEKGRLKRLYNSVMARGDIVIANSGFTADLVAARYGTPRDRLRVIYRGVEGDRFDPAAIAADRVAELRRRWGLDAGQSVILQAARLTGWKGQSVLIEAAGLLDRGGHLSDAVVVLAGDDQGRTGYRAELAGQIARLGLAGKVRLVGHCDDMPAAFLLARVAVVASTEPEAFGRAATEAQVMGCPVIATAIGAPPETVLAQPGVEAGAETGWLVPPGDAAALAARLAEALDLDPRQRRAMGERARAHVLTRFSLEGMKRQTLAVYDDLAGLRLAAAFDAAGKPEIAGAGPPSRLT
jgi:glycosyltransferase involved in cell wall biosynthesis